MIRKLSFRVLTVPGIVLSVVFSSAATELKTNQAKSLVPLHEIISGGPPPDGIPPIDRPSFVASNEADRWLKPKEPVLSVVVSGDARAYPLQILIWHEIVNDVVGGTPVAATYCPLCNSGIVFDRRFEGRLLDFGTSGKLYKSDLVMYDRQTHSLWAQMEGRAIVGDLAGAKLSVLPANTLAYGDWREVFPRGKVLSRETGVSRRYGLNPYEGYDERNRSPFLFFGQLDRRLAPKERVVGITLGAGARAYPFSPLTMRKVIADALDGRPLVIFWRPGTLSVLDHSVISSSRDVGATAVFSSLVDGRSLSFGAVEEGFRDRETGSLWTFLGRGVAGPLSGRQLAPVQHVDAFWFAWSAFHPSTSIFGGR